MRESHVFIVFFFNDTATTEIYTLSLHDALPICLRLSRLVPVAHTKTAAADCAQELQDRGGLGEGFVDSGLYPDPLDPATPRSEEHTSELQSPCNIVCRLLLENKKTKNAQSDQLD